MSLTPEQITATMISFGFTEYYEPKNEAYTPAGPLALLSYYHSQLGIRYVLDPNTLDQVPITSEHLAFRIIKAAMDEGARRKANQIRKALLPSDQNSDNILLGTGVSM